MANLASLQSVSCFTLTTLDPSLLPDITPVLGIHLRKVLAPMTRLSCLHLRETQQDN